MEQDIQEINEPTDELTNDVVTVSKLQIALKAEAYRLQIELSEIAVQANTAVSEGLFELLQKAAALLLINAEYWTHVLANSQTVSSREEGENLFTQLSLRERSKFSAETLSNVNGVVETRSLPSTAEDPAYIVVTLLLGTADDQPLFGEIYSNSLLRDVLQGITMMLPRDLLVFELLWSPQAAIDSLTEAELASEYGDMEPIG